MSFAIEPMNQHSVIVRIGTALDLRNADAFKEACLDRVRDGTRNFILDFSESGILDSTGLGAIFALRRQLEPLKGKVIFASVSGSVKIVIQLTRIYKVFQSYPSVEAAREALIQPTA